MPPPPPRFTKAATQVTGGAGMGRHPWSACVAALLIPSNTHLQHIISPDSSARALVLHQLPQPPPPPLQA